MSETTNRSPTVEASTKAAVCRSLSILLGFSAHGGRRDSTKDTIVCRCSTTKKIDTVCVQNAPHNATELIELCLPSTAVDWFLAGHKKQYDVQLH
mmetsp:Transcript_1069/g.2948  ORF Transcript_1069/g.2948 Transcript_1069/m.2948 type:complete len:95 (-) Transcript_1069:173-457(-)